MAEQITNYQCPACTGPLHYSESLGKLKCDYCGTEYEVAEIEAMYAKKEEKSVEAQKKAEKETEQKKQQQAKAAEEGWDTSDISDNWGKDAAGMKSYNCPSCGAELICDETTAATSCPYCGNPTVVPGQFSGVLKPDYVIPFKLDKKAAKAGLERHLSGKTLLPKVFRDQNHIDEIKGIYVPFWLFDADAEADIRYKGTTVRTWSDSDYNYTQTSYYSILRGGRIGFERVPVDGSSKMEDDLMESIEPYDFKDAVDFQTAYLAGYLADKYDVNAEESIGHANRRIRQSTEDAFRATVKGYSGVVVENSNVRLENSRVKYALYPVWILNTTWQGKKYRFAMNGQTGKFVGNLPTDKGAYVRWFVGLTAGISVAAFSILSLLWML